MPSPIGHALAGIATAWALDGVPHVGGDELPGTNTASRRRQGWTLTLVCGALAVLPDADLMYSPIHRRMTHSLVAIAVTFIVAAAVTGWVTRRMAWRTAAVCAAALATHLLMDWLGSDPRPPHGIQVLWPFSEQWFVSTVSIFPGTERQQIFTAKAILINFIAGLSEIALVGPLVVLVAWLRRRRHPAVASLGVDVEAAPGLAAKVAGIDHAAE